MCPAQRMNSGNASRASLPASLAAALPPYPGAIPPEDLPAASGRSKVAPVAWLSAGHPVSTAAHGCLSYSPGHSLMAS